MSKESGKMPDSDNVKTNPSIVLREEYENEAMLFNPDTGDTYELNPTGVMIWKRLDGWHTVDQIQREIEEKFENVPDSATQHIKAFILELVKKGFTSA